MTDKRDARRADLRDRLIEAAAARIAENGYKGLRARDVTADAGCALGGLYSVFADLDDLVLHVNARTLAELQARLEDTLASAASPEERLHRLAGGYLEFASESRNLWAALFDHPLADMREVPSWHLDQHIALFRLIVDPLEALMPDDDDDAVLLRARSVFAAVHGIITLSLEGRFVGLPRLTLKQELHDFLDTLIRGIRSS